MSQKNGKKLKERNASFKYLFLGKQDRWLSNKIQESYKTCDLSVKQSLFRHLFPSSLHSNLATHWRSCTNKGGSCDRVYQQNASASTADSGLCVASVLCNYHGILMNNQTCWNGCFFKLLTNVWSLHKHNSQTLKHSCWRFLLVSEHSLQLISASST